jgi:hypothetical protein
MAIGQLLPGFYHDAAGGAPPRWIPARLEHL